MRGLCVIQQGSILIKLSCVCRGLYTVRVIDRRCSPQCLMAGRLLKVSSVATALVATSGVYLYTKQLDPNDLSLVRFGRAAAAVSGTL